MASTGVAKNTMIGTPATAMMIVCPICNCEAFRLLAPAPAPFAGKVGDRLPSGKWRITTAECIACGEQCEPFAPYERS
jgi:hypothetical protein